MEKMPVTAYRSIYMKLHIVLINSPCNLEITELLNGVLVCNPLQFL